MANDGEGAPPDDARGLPRRPHGHRDDTHDDVYRQSQVLLLLPTRLSGLLYGTSSSSTSSNPKSGFIRVA